MTAELKIRIGEQAEIADLPVRLLSIDAETATLGLGDDQAARTFRKKFRRPAGCSAADEAAVIDLAIQWCRRVTKITVLNQPRFAAIHARLSADGYKFQACMEAVAEYGKSSWHRKKKVWLDISKFFVPEKLEPWILKVTERGLAAAKRQGDAPAVNPQIRFLIKQPAKELDHKSEAARALHEFDVRPGAERTKIQNQARKELAELHPSWQPRIIKGQVLRQHILVILRREGA